MHQSGGHVKISVEEIMQMYNRRREINRCPLKDLEIYESGVLVNIDPKLIEEWDFTGLSNIDFITSDVYKNGIAHEDNGTN